ncbi:MAG: HAMP domain-containing sensor histidine kinase [Candidatus Riflebacteria bacterium]
MNIRAFFPRTIFGRLFVSIFLVSILCSALIFMWLNQRFFQSLNQEAEGRLINMARTLAGQIDKVTGDEPGKINILNNFWQFEKDGAWLQNLYWLDVSGSDPRFVASFSAVNPKKISILPPSAEDIEDLVFSNINELEKGRVVMPDPFSAADSRRYKIVLFPLLDQFQLLDSVIGIEADLEYLHLSAAMREFFLNILVAVFLFSLLISLLVAYNFSQKTSFLVSQLKEIEKGSIPAGSDLHLRELNLIHEGMISMAGELERKDRHLRELFARKLEELAFTGAAIAHEIRNPLSAIEMHFGLLKRRLQKLENASCGEVEEISTQLVHLRRLLESFLNYSRLVQPQKEEIRLDDFLRQFIDSRKDLWKNLEMQLQVDPETLIFFDRTMLQQVCDNIIGNAAALAIPLCIQINFKKSEESWKLSFVNNGPLIDEELLARLFTPFATARPGGNGIGLALTRKLVEAHSGEISCRNLENGVVFEIEVPS